MRRRPLDEICKKSIGKKFGRWTLLSVSAPNEIGQRFCKVKCDCGTLHTTLFNHIRRGQSKQCSKCRNKAVGQYSRIDGRSAHPMYPRWSGLKLSGNLPKYWHNWRVFITEIGKPIQGKKYLVPINPARPISRKNFKWADRPLHGWPPRHINVKGGPSGSITQLSEQLKVTKQYISLSVQKGYHLGCSICGKPNDCFPKSRCSKCPRRKLKNAT